MLTDCSLREFFRPRRHTNINLSALPHEPQVGQPFALPETSEHAPASAVYRSGFVQIPYLNCSGGTRLGLRDYAAPDQSR